MDDLDKLKEMAAPVSERIASSLDELVELEKQANIKLGVICNYKEEQKQGDITYRKKSNKQGLAGIFIAVVAVYISIKAYNGPLMMLIS